MKTIRLSITDRPVCRYTRDARTDEPESLPVSREDYERDIEPLARKVFLLTPGNVLHAESAPHDPHMLGRTWTGELHATARDLRSAVLDAVAAHRTEAPEDVDVSEVLQAVETLHTALGTEPQQFASVAEGVKRLKTAADAVTRHATRTGDALRRNPMLAPRHTVGDGSRPMSPDQINARNREFWKAQAPVGTRDAGAASTQVRDHVAAASRAKTERERIEAIGRANAAFWSPSAAAIR